MSARGRLVRRRRATSLALGAAVTVVFVAGSAAGAQRVALPTEADVIPIAPNEETILYGNKGIETLLPGTVDDDERVTVAIAPDGTPVSVGVRQRLVVHGLGDFRFKVSGPAQDVEALPGSEAEPGLRKGAVLWQGFSDGKKVLASEMNMFPKEEARRLPVRVSAEATVGGAPAADGASGPFRMDVTVSNVSSGPVTITSAEGDPSELAGALDAIAGELRAGDRPRPGLDGVPTELTALRGVKGEIADIAAPFHVEGQLRLPAGLNHLSVTGGRTVGGDNGSVVRFDGLVGGGEPDEMTVSVTGIANDLEMPLLDVVARPAPPAASEAQPDGGGTWARALGQGDAPDARDMWDRLMNVSWQVAKLRQYDTYLGNPDPAGPGTTVYRFRLAEPEAPPGPSAGGPIELTTSPLLATTAILALLFLAFDGLLLWSLL